MRSTLEAFPADPESFHSPEYEPRLAAMLEHVVATEGPIHEDVLVRRIARHHGFKRSGRQIRDVLMRIAQRRFGKSRESVGQFFWPRGAPEERVAPARHEGREDELRKVEHICAAEIRAIGSALSLGGDALAIARALGLKRLSESSKARIERCFQA